MRSTMTESELRDQAKAFRPMGCDTMFCRGNVRCSQCMASFAAEAVRVVRERIVKELDNKVFPFNNDERHNMADPCLVCEILDTLDAIAVELRGEQE